MNKTQQKMLECLVHKTFSLGTTKKPGFILSGNYLKQAIALAKLRLVDIVETDCGLKYAILPRHKDDFIGCASHGFTLVTSQTIKGE